MFTLYTPLPSLSSPISQTIPWPTPCLLDCEMKRYHVRPMILLYPKESFVWCICRPFQLTPVLRWSRKAAAVRRHSIRKEATFEVQIDGCSCCFQIPPTDSPSFSERFVFRLYHYCGNKGRKLRKTPVEGLRTEANCALTSAPHIRFKARSAVQISRGP